MRSILVIPAALLFFGLVSHAQICDKSQLTANLQNCLIAHYPFWGNANDESGNENNRMVNASMIATVVFYNPNSGYDFNAARTIISLSGPFFSGERVSIFLIVLRFWINIGFGQAAQIEVSSTNVISFFGSIPDFNYRARTTMHNVIQTKVWFSVFTQSNNNNYLKCLDGNNLPSTILSSHLGGEHTFSRHKISNYNTGLPNPWSSGQLVDTEAFDLGNIDSRNIIYRFVLC